MFTGLGHNLRSSQTQKMSWLNHSILIFGCQIVTHSWSPTLQTAVDQAGLDSSNGFSRRWSYSASPQWWHRCCHRTQCRRTMQHTTFRSGNYIHAAFCWLWSYSASPEWWQCCRHWRQWNGTMQHPTFGWWNSIHPDFCRLSSYSFFSVVVALLLNWDPIDLDDAAYHL